MQISGEIERSDIAYEGEESFEGELIETSSQDRDHDDIIVVGGSRTAPCWRLFVPGFLQTLKVVEKFCNFAWYL